MSEPNETDAKVGGGAADRGNGPSAYFYGRADSPGHHIYPWDRTLDTWELRQYAYETPGGPSLKDARRGDWDPNAQPQGVWRMRYHAEWDLTFYGCWDRSGDHRFGSVSVLIAPGYLDETAMRQLFAREFPNIWARIEAAGS